MNFTAIDFETATADRASACSVGVVVVKDGKIADRFVSLIRPPNLEFNSKNIAIHGITPDDVAKKPTFHELWPKLEKFFGSDILVAHSAAFDMSVLHRCLDVAGIAAPAVKCVCTVSVARQLLPGLENHRLPTLAALFGVNLEHHKAVADAETCARIAMILARLAEPSGLAGFARDYCDSSIQPESAHHNSFGIVVRVSMERGIEISMDGEESQQKIDRIASKQTDAVEKRLTGLNFVFTGVLGTMSREDAESLVRTKGAEASDSVSRKTDYVVVGDAIHEAYRRTGHTTGKLAKAVALQTNGEKVKIIAESDWLSMIR